MHNFVRWAERAFAVMLAMGLFVRFRPAMLEHPQLVLFLLSEACTAIFIVFQRRGDWTSAPFPVAVAFLGTIFPLLAMPYGTTIGPEWLSTTLMVVGAGIAIGSKLMLRRSFGLIAANRGVKTSGLYRLVRHPMYAGYILIHIGLLIVRMSPFNLALFSAAWLFLWLRMREEERFLLQDPAYREYAQRVRYRVFPGVA